MIPPRGDLEALQGYTDEELDILDAFRPLLEGMDQEDRSIAGRKLLRQLWPDEMTFIAKTHVIVPKEAAMALLKPNFMQRRFYNDVIVRCRKEARPIRAVILKARQLGASTFIQAWQYEQCEREKLHRAMTVSYDDDSTEELFAIARFVRHNQWFPYNTQRDRLHTLQFERGHGSIFYAQTAGKLNLGRSYTIQHLHCSEVPSWPDAGESLGAILQAVPAREGTSIFLESTAKGAVGQFYDDWNRAVDGKSDYIPFFAPWTWNPEYRLPFATDSLRRDFARGLDLTERKLIEHHGCDLEQLKWRRWKIQNDLQGSEAKFRQEYPTTAEEAFLTSGSPVFNPDSVMDLLRNATEPKWRGSITLSK